MNTPSKTPQRVCEVNQHESHTNQQYNKLAESVLKAINTPLSWRLRSSIKNQRFLELAHCKMPNPREYTDSNLFARDYLAYGLLRKSEHLPIQVDRAGLCVQKWLESEEACKRLNQRNGFIDRRYIHGPLEGSPSAIIQIAQAKIHRLLGKFSWDDAYASFGFSGGASTRLPRRNGHPFYKFSGKPEVTRNAALLAVCAIWHSPVWRRDMQDRYGNDPVNWVTIVEGSRFTTVGKTALIDRGICLEPDMNMFMQKGIGAVLRNKLKAVRIDLNDQTRNQQLARIGSSTGSLVTIDLAAASDSISLSLVNLLLPPDWYDAVCRTRCEVVTLPCGKKHFLQKVSSMGNGFTFELESLIFWALAAATLEALDVSDKRLGVYGDDIVIHNSAADALIGVLACTGFNTNVDKTFVDGPFRESCGKHYFHGQDVTPFYVKSQNGTQWSDYFWLANSFNRWLADRDTLYRQGQGRVIKSLRKACLLKGESVKDLVVVPHSAGLRAGYMCDLHYARNSRTLGWNAAYQSYSFKQLVPSRKKHRPNGIAAYLYALMSPCIDDIMVVEKGEQRVKLRRSSTSAWDSLTD